jgi:hypothetical protein
MYTTTSPMRGAPRSYFNQRYFYKDCVSTFKCLRRAGQDVKLCSLYIELQKAPTFSGEAGQDSIECKHREKDVFLRG